MTWACATATLLNLERPHPRPRKRMSTGASPVRPHGSNCAWVHSTHAPHTEPILVRQHRKEPNSCTRVRSLPTLPIWIGLPHDFYRGIEPPHTTWHENARSDNSLL